MAFTRTTNFLSGPASFRNIELPHALLTLMLLALSLFVSGTAHAGSRHERFAAGHILVKPRIGVADAQFLNTLARHGNKDRGRVHATRMHVVDVAPGSEQAAVAALALDPTVEAAEVDRLVEPEVTTANDTYYLNAWHLAKIGAPIAWDTAKGDGVVVAVLDSGVDGTHPDLVNKLVPGWNLVDNNSNTSDVYGHGTEVAGVIGAQSNNGLGVTSIAWGAKIMPVRVSLTTGSAYISTIAAGITWAADHGANIANASFATLTGSATIQSAANYMRSKGGLVVVAAGNYGTLDSTSNNSSVISVSATDSSDALTSWSSYGPYVDVAAPGAGIWSTTRGGGYAAVSGTSFSSPLTAGVLAVMKSANPALSNVVLESILKSTAVDLGTPGVDSYFGAGRINAGAAVAAAAAYGADTAAPTVAIAAPTGGTVSAVVPVNISATDNTGVTRVELYAGSTLVGSATTAPFAFSWDTKSVVNGSVSLKAYAFDKAGNKGGSAPVSVTVNNFIDTTAPTVAITSPAAGTVKGAVTVSVNASDNVGVTRVDLYAGNNLLGTSNVAPYNFTWDTRSLADGNINLTAYAYDKAGNKGTSTSLAMNVSNFVDTTAPTVAIAAPLSGTVAATVTVSINATDNVGVTRVDLYNGSTLIGSSTASPFVISWNTKMAPNGNASLTAYAVDKAGNRGASRSVALTVSNVVADTTAPVVNILSPLNSSVVKGTVTISAAATDNVRVTAMYIYVDGTLRASASIGSLRYSWSTNRLARGAHAIMAMAKDAAGNVATRSINVMIDHGTTSTKTSTTVLSPIISRVPTPVIPRAPLPVNSPSPLPHVNGQPYSSKPTIRTRLPRRQF